MRTLFIHPRDITTDFCSAIYENYRNVEGVTIINDINISNSTIIDALRNNDRIVLIGHGTEFGLLDMVNYRYVITSEEVHLFQNIPVLCIWCNANIFAERHNLNSFSTGMFVSEISEAIQYNLPTDQNLIDESNELFCRILSECIFDDPISIREIVEREYRSQNNPIIDFNRECMGFSLLYD